jgi:phosphomannomutase
MINKSIFKAYDIRGIYPTDVNEESVSIVGRACVKMFDEGELILAHDARHGSPELMKILEKSILDEAKAKNKKITVRTVGFSTTPMFYFLVNHFNAPGGCMITASHNPSNYNGIKMVTRGAVTISGTDVLKVIETL